MLHLDDEHVIVELWLEAAETPPELTQHIRRERNEMPVLALAKGPGTTPHEIDVSPKKPGHFRAPQSCALHQHDRRTLVADRRRPNRFELVEARTIDVCAPLSRPTDLRRRIDLDLVLDKCPVKERMKD